MSADLYTLPQVQRMLGVSRSAIQRLIAAGFVIPDAGGFGGPRFSYRDVVVLRTACALRKVGILPRKAKRALHELQRRWIHDCDVQPARVRTSEDHMGVPGRNIRLPREKVERPDRAPGSGAPDSPNPLAAPDAKQQDEAADAGRSGGDLTLAGDPVHAEAAWRRALVVDPTLLEAALSLGYLLCESGRCRDALSVYEGVIAHGADSPMLQFSLGVALEGTGDLRGALSAYNRCIDELPDFAEAHFNAARMHNALGDLGAPDPAS
ncbi:helix-turn-helix domain-containing protein [Paraburkholderia tropica]|uniref:helix-turn-helix domain-containing protein n=1 Tax=Paraburkholderia tropica TaxID=92647 RepID=UPI002AB5FC8B|nr:tetratricopeptide repeat protein [Paraburkholderia tropica]